MLNFGDAFGFLFKEKNWFLKFLIPLSLILISALPLTVVTLIESKPTDIANVIKTVPNGIEVNWNLVLSSQKSELSPLMLVTIIFSCITGIISLIFMLWYQYDITQSGIEKRESTAIWKEPFLDVIKKAAKTIILAILYWIFPVTLALCIVCFAGIVGLSGLAGGLSNFSSLQNSFSKLLEASLLVVAIFLCIGCVLAVIMGLYQILIVQPAMLILTKTNTFGEGLKLGKAFRIGRKYFFHFLLAYAIIVIVTIVMLLPLNIGTNVASFVFAKSKPMEVLTVSVITIFTSIVSLYLSFFQFRLLGGLFREILKREDKE